MSSPLRPTTCSNPAIRLTTTTAYAVGATGERIDRLSILNDVGKITYRAVVALERRRDWIQIVELTV